MGLFNALVSGTLLPWNWFRRGSRETETDYETILSALSRDIASVQTRLTQIRTRERRASVTLTIQAFFIWALYTAICWWLGLFQAEWHNSSLLVVWLPVAGAPFLIVFTRKFVRWWYRRIGAAEEKHLIQLKTQQRDKIDEIKRATKYDHLRRLLEMYDDTKSPAGLLAKTPQQQQQQQHHHHQQQQQEQQRQQQPNQGPQSTPSTPQSNPGVPLTPHQASQRMAAMRQQAPGFNPASLSTASQQLPAIPLQRTWMDKLADAILGADPSLAGPEQKYALICMRCHSHNGLALKEEFDEIQYICPHCGMFNSRRKSTTPQSSPFTPLRTRPKPKEGDHDNEAPAKPLNESESDDEPSSVAAETNIDPKPLGTAEPSVRARKSRLSTSMGMGMDMDMDED